MTYQIQGYPKYFDIHHNYIFDIHQRLYNILNIIHIDIRSKASFINKSEGQLLVIVLVTPMIRQGTETRDSNNYISL